MRCILASLFLLLSSPLAVIAQVQPIWPENLDVLPRFTGGPNALSKYMNDNLQYPESAEMKGVEGKVYVLFNVEKDGTITNVKIGKSVDPDLDQEAVRLVKGMPKWEPGRKHGKATLVKNMRMPITFRIDKEGFSPNFASNSPSSPETATFPGGQLALIKYTLDNFHYPESAKMNGIESTVSVSFWVESDGSIIDMSATSSANTDRLVTKEALRLVKGMPKWIPGMRAGKLIRGYYTLNLICRLNDEQSKTPMPFFTFGGPYKIEEGKDKQQIMKSLFPGGQTALDQFLKENTKYQDINPYINRNSTFVVVEFMVETDGSLSDLNVVEHIDSIHDNEALRVVKSMPKWIPAKNKDGELGVYIYSLPISFIDSTKLKDNSKPKVSKELLQLQPRVFFPWGKSTIDNVGYAMIEMVAKYLKKHPEYALIVKGYTSANMESKQSLKVSEDRAVAVKQALVKRYGIETGRISAQGAGATQDLDDFMEFNNVVLFFIYKMKNGTADKQQTATQATSIQKPQSAKVDVSKEISAIDQMPSFPGGTKAMFQFLSSNVKYPAIAEANGIQGVVIVVFNVDTDGNILNVKVVKSVDPALDKEAIRVVKSMPKWIPCKDKNGKPIIAEYTLPITFKLQNKGK